MRRSDVLSLRFGVVTAVAIVGGACGWSDADRSRLEAEPTVYGDRNVVPPRPVSVEGCLTARDGRFVLTDLARAAASDAPAAAAAAGPTTEAYRLVGMEDRLQPLVGQRIVITGETEPEQVVQIREISPAVASGDDARVASIATTRIAISDLRVWTVTPENEPCRTAPPIAEAR